MPRFLLFQMTGIGRNQHPETQHRLSVMPEKSAAAYQPTEDIGYTLAALQQLFPLSTRSGPRDVYGPWSVHWPQGRIFPDQHVVEIHPNRVSPEFHLAKGRCGFEHIR